MEYFLTLITFYRQSLTIPCHYFTGTITEPQAASASLSTDDLAMLICLVLGVITLIIAVIFIIIAARANKRYNQINSFFQPIYNVNICIKPLFSFYGNLEKFNVQNYWFTACHLFWTRFVLLTLGFENWWTFLKHYRLVL